ncbi:hypothetical protein ACFLU6_05355 [Acidobacteriota bacterium]
MMQNTELGRFIRTCRVNHRFSCQRVEELSLTKSHFERISPANLVDIEHGRHVPSFGKLLTLSEIFDVPLFHFEDRFRLDREEKDPAPNGATVENLTKDATAFLKIGQYSKALTSFKNARKLAGDEAPECLALDISIANCRRRMGMLRVAREDYERILASKELPDKQRIMASTYLADIFRISDNFYLSRLLLREAITLARKKHANMLPIVQEYMGMLLYWNNDFTRALSEYRKALQGHKKKKNRLSISITLSNMALCYMHKSEFIEAEQLYLTSLHIARELNHLRTISRNYCNMAELHFMKQDFGKTKQHAIQALNIARVNDYHDILCQASYFLWEIARMSGNTPEANRTFKVIRKHIKKLEYKLPTLKPYYEYVEQIESDNGDDSLARR